MNFEIHQADGFICDHQFASILKKTNPKINLVIICCTKEINGDIVVEENYISRFQEKFRQVITKLKTNNRKIVLFLNTWYYQYRDIFEIDLIDEVVYIDMFLYDTYKKLVIEKQSKLVEQYCPLSKNQFLFLMNKPSSRHRIELLYKLYKKDLLKDAVYSFIIHNDFTDTQCRKILHFLSSDEFDSFYDQTKRSLDLKYNTETVKKVNHTHYTGIPYDVKLFQDCNFQLISETHFDMTVWITEKTWISMMNQRPFIIAAYPGFLKRLKDMGFKTFENYMLHTDYDETIDDNKRLDLIVENVNYWLKNIQEYADVIKKDVKHNFDLLLEYARKNQNKLDDFNSRYNIVLNLNGYSNYKEQIWYEGIV